MDYSQITETLFIGVTPHTENYAELRRLGVRLVINMRFERRPRRDLHNPPMPVLWLRTIDSPLFPISIRALCKGVRKALRTMEEGGKVYAHCAGGKHRGVAMGAAILIAQGYSADEAIEIIKQNRPTADPDIWYIRKRIKRFSKSWNAKDAAKAMCL